MAEPLKNMFNQGYPDDLGAALEALCPPFGTGAFLARVIDDQWEGRAFKERMRRMTTVLHGFLPQDYPTALDILRRAAPALSQYGFENMIFPDFVGVYGLDDWEASIPALEQFPQLVGSWTGCRAGLPEAMVALLRIAADSGRSYPTSHCRARQPGV